MKYILMSLSILAACAPGMAFAAIDVDFESTPLFGESNFLPGDTISKTVKVTNTGEDTEDVYTELYNVIDGGLAEKVDVVISAGAALFSGSFDDLVDAHKVPLTSLNAGEDVTYTFAFSFEPASGNAYQHTSLGFDLCVGFSGGELECDTDDNPHYAQGSYSGYAQSSYNGYAQGSYGGGEEISLRDGGGDRDDEGPIPRVLGAETSTLPFGAPNTGLGGLFGSAENTARTTVLILIGAVIALLYLIRKKLEAR